jgi:hypothetical protein
VVVDQHAAVELEHAAARPALPVIEGAVIQGELPDPCGVVPARGDHARAVGAERRRPDRALMREGSVTGLPVRASHTRTVPSSLAVTTRAPSG